MVENGSGDDSEARLRAALGDQDNVGSSSRPRTSASPVAQPRCAKASGESSRSSTTTRSRTWTGSGRASPPSPRAPGSPPSPRKVLDWDGSAIDFVEAGLTWFGMGYKAHIAEHDDGRFDTPQDILFGTGSALFVRRAVFLEVGGFDEGLFMFYDDVDLGWRLNLLGYRVRFAPRLGRLPQAPRLDEVVRRLPRDVPARAERPAPALQEPLRREPRRVPPRRAGAARPSRGRQGRVATRRTFDIRRFTGAPDEFDADHPDLEGDRRRVLRARPVRRRPAKLRGASRRDPVAARQRTDKEVFRLFGDIFQPLFERRLLPRGLPAILEAFAISRR